MRAAVIGLLLAGCSTGVDVIGVPDLDRPDPLRGLCLRVEPTTVVLDGTVAVEERAPATVTLTSTLSVISATSRA